ncbi:MAG TPA: CHAD domain-containing protein [Ilumatobacteraceae bacterium]|nr:CHAD domain-containing protein [Ilumatobacteraceae bacterium]
MAFVLDPAGAVRREVPRIAAERLDDAIEQLDAVIAGSADIETAVHEVRKRCKETRGLARLVQPALGDEFRPFDRIVRDAANQLSAMRDAHALLATLDNLVAAHGLDGQLRSIRDRQAIVAAEATSAIEAGDERIVNARNLLVEARGTSQKWTLTGGFDAIAEGFTATYRRGRRALRTAQDDPTDENLHEWRKSVKQLWYQTRLLRGASPSMIEPLIDELDGLADALGDDHDLAVLVATLDADPDQFGAPDIVDHARRVAREQQSELRAPAFRTGEVIYAERPSALRSRVEAYWHLAGDVGPELPTGGIAALISSRSGTPQRPTSTVERERKFLIDAIPADLDLADRTEMRQGYLTAEQQASVRVRDAGPNGYTLTVKAGSGAERTELEWAIDREQFDVAWPHTEGRRVVKTRHRIPFNEHVIELDVFGDGLDGLMFAEVEFDSSDALEVFEPPAWFGREVTDDGRYTNAALALHGRPKQ